MHTTNMENMNNSFEILAGIRKRARKAGMSQEKIDAYLADAISSDREHLEDTCIKWACELEIIATCPHQFTTNPQSRFKRCVACGLIKKDN